MKNKVKCLCLGTSQKRTPGGRTKLYKKGDVEFFDKCPSVNWRPFNISSSRKAAGTEEGLLVFDNLTDEELTELSFDADELRAYMEKHYPEVKIHHQLGLSKMVALFIESRKEKQERESIAASMPISGDVKNGVFNPEGDLVVEVETSEESDEPPAEDIDLDDLDAE